jgi:hypothetical protein
MGIKVIKDKRLTDYTFIDDSLNLVKSVEKKEFEVKQDKVERNFRLIDNTKVNKLKKSKISGGHSMQGHSPVYE